jgi:hypothetical protein
MTGGYVLHEILPKMHQSIKAAEPAEFPFLLQSGKDAKKDDNEDVP